VAPTSSLRIAFAVAASAALPVCASDWTLAPTLGWIADHDTNRQLSSEQRAGNSTAIALDLDITAQGEITEFKMRPRLLLQRFTDEVGDDVNDLGVSMSARRAFERSLLSFSADVADESTLNPDVAVTGIVAGDARRRMTNAQLGWQWQQSATKTLVMSAAGSDVRYSGARADRLFDYRYSSFHLRETWSLSARTSVFASGIASILDSLERDSRTQERGGNLGIDFALSASTTMSASAGKSWRSTEDVRTQGSTYDLSVSHKQELREWSFGYSRSLVPYGTGVLAEQDSLNLKFIQPLSPRLDFVANASAIRNRDVGLGLTLDRRNYARAETSLSWHVKRTLVLGSALRFTSATLPDDSGDTQGFNFGISMYWQPDATEMGH
jgi:hypothetical protein